MSLLDMWLGMLNIHCKAVSSMHPYLRSRVVQIFLIAEKNVKDSSLKGASTNRKTENKPKNSYKFLE